MTKSVLLALTLIGCVVLAVACLYLLETVQRQRRQIHEQQARIAELENRIPATSQQKEIEFESVAREIERHASGWAPCDMQKMARVVIPIRCDLQNRRMQIVVERGDAGRGGVTTHYYDVALVFRYQRGKWVPQWDQSTARHENAVSPGPLEETGWLRDLLYDALARYVTSG